MLLSDHGSVLGSGLFGKVYTGVSCHFGKRRFGKTLTTLKNHKKRTPKSIWQNTESNLAKPKTKLAKFYFSLKQVLYNNIHCCASGTKYTNDLIHFKNDIVVKFRLYSFTMQRILPSIILGFFFCNVSCPSQSSASAHHEQGQMLKQKGV
jgi:hypothetical protein